MDNNYSTAITELLYLLKGFSKKYVNKIPMNVLNFFEKNKNEDYVCNFNYNDNIKSLNLKKETYGLLGLICYNYWCETDEEKKRIFAKTK